MVLKYIDYFRQLAIKHPSIMHNAAAETQDGDPTRCRFGRFWNVDLYLEKPPGGILSDDVSLHLQLFDFNLNSHTGHFDLKGFRHI